VGRSLIAWAFDSPRRLLLVVLTPLFVASTAPFLLSQLSHDEVARGEATRPTTSLATPPTAASTPSDETVAPATPPPEALHVVDTFVEIWLAGATVATGGDVQEWHKRLARYATPELSAALRDTDPSRIPDSTPTGPAEALQVGEYLSQVTVPMADRRDLHLTVAWDGQSWRVSDIDREGGP
jgi:hypothetical protein